MTPQTKWWHELLREQTEEPAAADLEDQEMDNIPRDDPRYLQLELKKKHMNNLLKRMLVDGGYDDLARMTTLRRAGVEDGN